MKKIKVGIVGAGAIAENCHIPNYKKLNNVEVVAILDIDKQRAKSVAAKFNIPYVYTDLSELLATDLDAVSICTPNNLHASHSIQATEAGKHVLVEKPMCISLEEADAIINKSAEMSKILMVSFTHRFHDHNTFVKETLTEGLIGQPLNYRMRFAHRGPYESWKATSNWFYNAKEAGGGAFLDMGIHALDLMRFFGGEIESIWGHSGKLLHDINVEDFSYALIKFKNKAYGQIETGWYSHEGFNGYEIYGTEGTIICDYKTVRIYKERKGDWQWVEKSFVGNGWYEEIKYFIQSVQSGILGQCTANDGRRALELVMEMED